MEKNSYRSGPRDLNFGQILSRHTFFVHASSECSGKSAQMRRLACAFVVRQCNKYLNLIS